MKLRAMWGHLSAQRIGRVSVGSEGGNLHVLRYVDKVSGRCEVCRSLDCTPHVAPSGTPTVSMFNERLQIDLLFLDDIVALHRMDVFSKNSSLYPVRFENPQEAWGAFQGLRFEIFRPPKSIQMGEGGESMHEVQTEYCLGRRALPVSQRMDAGPCTLERRNGLAR